MLLAESLLRGASRLDGGGGDYGPSSHILSLQALEILLKAALRVENGEIPKREHKYHDLFSKLSVSTRKLVIDSGRARYGPDTLGSTDAVMRILSELSCNYTGVRYQYEKYRKLNDDQLFRKGKDWADRGFREEDADFRYFPSELDALTFGLRSWLRQRLELGPADERF